MKKINVITLGCSKNTVDSEHLMARLAAAGYEVLFDSDRTDAKVVVINTCGFIGDAKQESVDMILRAAAAKNAGKIERLFVIGCLSERYADSLRAELPEVDGFFGARTWDGIARALGAAEDPALATERHLSTPRHYAYLKISEGCNWKCGYCAIPLIRGGFRSRPMEDILEEARNLAASGVKELNLIAQDTTKYGQDLYGEYSLDRLLTELCRIEGFHWIRVLYGYPDRVTDGLLDVMAREEKVVKYIDLPLQHANGRVLRAMNRGGDFDSLCALMQRIRDKVPGVVLRTTLIAGFPGETEEEFAQLCEFVKTVRFDRLGCFAYSVEEDTPAAELPDQLDEQTKLHRADIVMEEQMGIAFEKGRELIGRTLEVLVESYDEEQMMFVGRSYMDAPDIDTKTMFTTAREDLELGTFVQVEILDAVGYDLIGREVE